MRACFVREQGVFLGQNVFKMKPSFEDLMKLLTLALDNNRFNQTFFGSLSLNDSEVFVSLILCNKPIQTFFVSFILVYNVLCVIKLAKHNQEFVWANNPYGSSLGRSCNKIQKLYVIKIKVKNLGLN